MDYSFNTEIAQLLDVNAAVFIQNIAFWIMKNKANKKHNINGYTWTYNTNEAFANLFLFWSIDQIKRIIKKLKDKNIIKVENHNSKKYDRTSWYTIIDEKILSIYDMKNPQ